MTKTSEFARRARDALFEIGYDTETVEAVEFALKVEHDIAKRAGVEACIAALNLLVTVGERPSAMSTDDELETYRRFASTVRAHDKMSIIGSLAMFIADELAAGRLLK